LSLYVPTQGLNTATCHDLIAVLAGSPQSFSPLRRFPWTELHIRLLQPEKTYGWRENNEAKPMSSEELSMACQHSSKPGVLIQMARPLTPWANPLPSRS
jgi:hypothetical protein